MNGINYLALVIANIPQLTARGKSDLVRYIDSREELKGIEKKDVPGILNMFMSCGDPVFINAIEAADNIISYCDKAGIYPVTFHDPVYPPLLREIYSPPAVIYVRGKLPSSDIPSAAIVGTRAADGVSLKASYDTAFCLSISGIGIVSGLARGIDSEAHKGALDSGGCTVAVLGSGVDIIYPKENKKLAERIISENGSLVSEYRPGTFPEKYHFPERNRIISGIARGTAVIQAPEKSGSLITSSYALEQGRDVFVHSSGLKFGYGSGGAFLAESGAMVINCGEDILCEWGMSPASDDYRINNSLDRLFFNTTEKEIEGMIINHRGVYYRRRIYA